jgi:hypothetical protein
MTGASADFERRSILLPSGLRVPSRRRPRESPDRRAIFLRELRPERDPQLALNRLSHAAVLGHTLRPMVWSSQGLLAKARKGRVRIRPQSGAKRCVTGHAIACLRERGRPATRPIAVAEAGREPWKRGVPPHTARFPGSLTGRSCLAGKRPLRCGKQRVAIRDQNVLTPCSQTHRVETIPDRHHRQ